MRQIAATVSDPADIREFDCLLPADVPVGVVAYRLAEAARLPVDAPDGSPMAYGLVLRGGALLAPDETLQDAGVPEPIRARLVPELLVGSEEPGLFDSVPDDLDLLSEEPGVVILDERAMIHDEGLELPPDVRIDARVHRDLEDLASEDRQVERIGLLLGEVSVEGKKRVIHVTESVPALDAPGSRTSVKLTPRDWASLLERRDRDYPHLRLVGWFHTHAGWGVFLSDADVFAHRHFFAHPNMVAHVMDPIAGRDGFFHWRDGSIVPCANYALVGTREQIASYKKPRPSAKAVLAIGVCAVLAAGVYSGSSFLSSRKPAPAKPVPKPPVQRKAAAPPRPVEQDRVYILGKNDNLWLVSKRVYGDGDLVNALAAYNHVSNLNGLQVGQEIKLPSRDKLIRFAETRPLPRR